MSAAPEAKYTEETVLWVEHHTPKLITFAISRPESYRFSAGQFSRLGLREGNGFIWRAYSVMSAEYADTLEYFAVLVENGPMSARLAALQSGDTILLDKNATGFLLPGRFPDGKDLVMLCTGSGIAPFLSILEQPEIWQRFDSLVLAHSVSYADELIFTRRIAALQTHPLVGGYFGKLTFLPVLTRERTAGALNQRLPELLASGALAAAAGRPFTPQNTRFMICGNPAMVKDTFQTLLDMGFSMHRNRIPGQIMMENGF
ncbi:MULTISPECIES: ferredoxin--NADP reductase [unclassified Neisseria]|uniref:ferredoxin--NADP reductase n=1 Tax=unclassified Neisseria TaxID=2623750 RepID=UPI001071E39A|nr:MULTISPECIES: ferredoxin--NADP reductase [unclassified Neisseria]MBF0804877.1 ferredoxin--NADP reductase [Neisseria sp. 19428wB4_WF04]TFU39411.1 ferredoxin--NADP reductase [Neisseria sp. WF04]